MTEELVFKGQKISRLTHRAILIGYNVLGFLFAIFYPNVGSVLAYVGSIAGFLIIYTIPVLVHLRQMREKIFKLGSDPDPEFDVSLEHINDKDIHANDDDKFSRVDSKTGKPFSSFTQEQLMWRKYYLSVAFNMMIPIYGFAIMML